MNTAMEDPARVRRRDRLRSFAYATSSVIKQEIQKYYDSPPNSSESSSPSISRSMSSNSLLSTRSEATSDPVSDKLQCILFPTYAALVQDDQQQYRWKTRLIGWTFALPTGAGRVDRWILAAGRTYGGLVENSAEETHFSNLLTQFRCQTMRGIDMVIKWTNDQVIDFCNSGPNGRFEHTLYLDPVDCDRAPNQQRWTLHASFQDIDLPPQPTVVDIIDPHGVSVISDIDDTIKVTDILDGKDVILQNTFFRKSKEIPGMSNVYQSWAAEGCKIHYVSNSPWQVFPAIDEFLRANHFPQGSVHLRSVSTQGLILGKPGQHKYEAITSIIKDFPHRKFVLIGDSGEIDAELYARIYHEFPDQIAKIFIHDVTSERAMHADRQAASRSDSLYNGVRRLVTSSSSNLRRTNTSDQAMEALAQRDIPKEQQIAMDPRVPIKTKLEQFEQRMNRISTGMRHGVFSVFSLSSQLLLDPIVNEELYMQKPSS